MPKQLSREEFEKSAREVIAAAPKGLTRDQFRNYVVSNVRAKQYETDAVESPTIFNQPVGESVKQAAVGAGSRVKNIVDSIGDTQFGFSPWTAVPGVVKYLATEPKRVGDEIGTGDPAKMGAGAVDTAALLTSAISGKRVAMDPAASAVKTVASKVNPAMIGDLAVAPFSKNPVRNTFRAVQGDGPLGRLSDRFFPTEKGAAAKNPNAGGSLVPKGFEAAVGSELESRLAPMVGPPAASHAPITIDDLMTAYLDDKAATGPRAHASTEFTRPNPNAGGTLQPHMSDFAADVSARLDGMAPGRAVVDDAGITQATAARLDDMAASPARHPQPTPVQSPNAGGRLTPNKTPGFVQQVQQTLEGMRAPAAPNAVELRPSHPGGDGMRTVDANQNAIRQMQTPEAPVAQTPAPTAPAKAAPKAEAPPTKAAPPKADPKTVPATEQPPSKPPYRDTKTKDKTYSRNTLKAMKEKFGTADPEEAYAKFGEDVVDTYLAEQKAMRHQTTYSNAQMNAQARRAAERDK